ncbi:MAG: AIR synthase-related protein [Lachnospiraceae bacterium]|nr:AIR synthase-related protein [Lachnospiraceae bacterium]
MELQTEGLSPGRLPEAVWKRSVLKQIRHRREELVSMRSGCCYGRLLTADSGEYSLLSAQIEERTGLLPALRQVLAAACEPIGITATLLLPEGTPEPTLRGKVAALEQECAGYGLDLMQIEPYVLSTVQEMLLQVTVIGRSCCSSAVPDGQRPDNGGRSLQPSAWAGESIVMTGWAGLEGTQRLIEERQEAAMARFPLHFCRKIEQYEIKRLPRMEQKLALEYGATAMYAAGESGILDALWQLGESVGKGMEIFLYQIPIRQETIELTDFLEQNPYQIASGGAFLIVTGQGEALVKKLRQEGIPAALIGTIEEGRDRIVRFGEERRYLEPYR